MFYKQEAKVPYHSPLAGKSQFQPTTHLAPGQRQAKLVSYHHLPQSEPFVKIRILNILYLRVASGLADKALDCTRKYLSF